MSSYGASLCYKPPTYGVLYIEKKKTGTKNEKNPAFAGLVVT
jgi:hypothetical protein